MSVGAKAAGFAALGRVVLYAFGELSGDWTWALAAISALTMTLGNLAALRQTNLKRLLAYSSIAHAGYILTGFAAASDTGATGLLFYLFAYACMNVGAFTILIAVSRFDAAGSGETLDDLAGLGARKPGLAVAMTLFMLSLAGVPPLAGFLAKLYVFGAAVQSGLAWLAAIGVINSVISAYYYLRVVVFMTMRQVEGGDKARVCPALQVGVALAALAVIVLGIWPPPLLDLARLAATALLAGW
jgi:NADH-quinone oxidoreductase subunit N